MATTDNDYSSKLAKLKPRNFEVAKSNLKNFVTTPSDQLSVDPVTTEGGLFNLGEHKVTGTELNNVAASLSQNIIKINGVVNLCVGEFGNLYNLIESLDKEYIPAIMSCVYAAEEASNQAKQANTDIKKMVEDQKKIIEVLKKHKEKIEEYLHLNDVDQIWEDLNNLQEEINKSKINLNSMQESINLLVGFKDKISSQKHFCDVDKIWGNEKENRKNIKNINQRISIIEEYCNQLKNLVHLNDIDVMWESIELQKKEIKDNKSELEQSIKHVDDMVEKMISKIDDIAKKGDSTYELAVSTEQSLDKTRTDVELHAKKLGEENEHSKEQISSLKVKLKNSYILSGVAIGISIVEFILNILGII